MGNKVTGNLNFLAMKYIYIYNPWMTGLQLVFLRSIISTIVTFLYVNKDLRKTMFTADTFDMKYNILYRVFCGGLLIKLFHYSSIREFKLTTISIILSLSPMIIVLLGFLILGEQITRHNLIVISIAFVAVVFIILGME